MESDTESATPYPVGTKARKVGGTYQADVTVVAVGVTSTGAVRYLCEFDELPGMLHVFNGGQLEVREEQAVTTTVQEVERLRTALALESEGHQKNFAFFNSEIRCKTEEIERLRTQSEESALARLRAWAAASRGSLLAQVTVDPEQDAEFVELLDLWEKGKIVSVYSKPVEANNPNIVGIGTEDKPASLGEMVEAALTRWAELYPDQ